MFGQIRDESTLREEVELMAGDYEMYHHVDYIFEKCLQMMQRMGF
jgi:RecA-family ATPase